MEPSDLKVGKTRSTASYTATMLHFIPVVAFPGRRPDDDSAKSHREATSFRRVLPRAQGSLQSQVQVCSLPRVPMFCSCYPFMHGVCSDRVYPTRASRGSCFRESSPAGVKVAQYMKAIQAAGKKAGESARKPMLLKAPLGCFHCLKLRGASPDHSPRRGVCCESKATTGSGVLSFAGVRAAGAEPLRTTPVRIQAIRGITYTSWPQARTQNFRVNSRARPYKSDRSKHLFQEPSYGKEFHEKGHGR